MTLAGNNKAFVLGPYITQCGGCDAIQPFALIPKLIEKYAECGPVIFEGVLIASCWGEVGRLMERWGQQALVMFLDTSPEECERRVKERRAQKGDDRPFNPKNLIQARAISRLKQKLDAANIVRTISVSSEDAVALLMRQFGLID